MNVSCNTHVTEIAFVVVVFSSQTTKFCFLRQDNSHTNAITLKSLAAVW